MDSPLTIGIDVGTTYCCVAVLRDGETKPEVIPNEVGRNTTPSFVAYDEEGDVYAGETAKDLAGDNPDSTVFDVKRLIARTFFDPHIQKDMNLLPFALINLDGMVGIKVGETKLLPQVITKDLIAHLREISEKYLACPIKKAVVTIPTYFNDIQQGLTRQACHEAGLKTVKFITEPTAAAYAYSLQSSAQPGETKTCLIFDLGGGTFDITIFKLDSQRNLQILATGGDAWLGGEDFNDLLTEYCIIEFKKKHSFDLNAGKNSDNDQVRMRTGKALRKIRTECERKKIHLSNVKKVTISADAVYGELDLVIPVTRKLFEDLIDGHLKRCIDTMENLLKKSGIEKRAIDNVVLIGGSSRIPKVQQVVSDFFGGKELLKTIHADEAVACGAAVYAYNVFGSSDADNVITVVDTAARMEPYVSFASIKLPGIDPGASERMRTSAPFDPSQEVLVKDLQAIKDVMMKHKHILLDKSEKMFGWLQNLHMFENDIKQNSQAMPSQRKVVISAMLDSPFLFEFANILYERFIDNDGFKLNELILKIQTSIKGIDHFDTIKTQFQIARCLDCLNYENDRRDAANALDLFRTVCAKLKRVLGESHKDTLTVEYHIANILKDHKKYYDALNPSEKTYKMQCSTLGPEKNETLCTDVLVASCLLETGKKNDAIRVGIKLYDKLKALSSNDSRIIVANKHALACVLWKTNKFKEALCLFEEVYQTHVSILGEDSFRSINARHNIGRCSFTLGKYSKALEIFTCVFYKWKEVLGPNHRDTLRAEHNIAASLYNKGKCKEAQDLYQQVYEKQEKHLGKNHPNTLCTMKNINIASSSISSRIAQIRSIFNL